jgi:hypothetical protein
MWLSHSGSLATCGTIQTDVAIALPDVTSAGALVACVARVQRRLDFARQCRRPNNLAVEVSVASACRNRRLADGSFKLCLERVRRQVLANRANGRCRLIGDSQRACAKLLRAEMDRRELKYKPIDWLERDGPPNANAGNRTICRRTCAGVGFGLAE